MTVPRNGFLDGDGCFWYWAAGDSHRGREVQAPSPVSMHGPDSSGHLVVLSEPDFRVRLHERGVRRVVLGPLLAPAPLVNGTTGLPCFFPFDMMAMGAADLWHGAAPFRDPVSPRTEGDRLVYRLRLLGLPDGLDVAYTRRAPRREVTVRVTPHLRSRVTAGLTVELLAPEDADLAVRLFGADGEPLAAWSRALRVPCGTFMNLTNVPTELSWLAITARVPATTECVAAGVFDVQLTAPAEPERREVVVAVDADAHAYAAALLSPNVPGRPPGPLDAVRLVTPNAVGGRLESLVSSRNPTCFGPWVIPRQPTDASPDGELLVRAILDSSLHLQPIARALRVQVAVSPKRHAPDQAEVQEDVLQELLHTRGIPVVVERTLATDRDINALSLAACYVCLNTPASNPLAIGVVADLRGDELRLAACVRGSALLGPPVLVGAETLPVGVNALLRQLATRLYPGRAAETVCPSAVLDLLRRQGGASRLASADLAWVEGRLHRFYVLLAEVVARFGAGVIANMRTVGPSLRSSVNAGIIKPEWPWEKLIERFLGEGHYWTRVALDGWGLVPLWPESIAGGLVPSNLADEVAGHIRSRLCALVDEVPGVRLVDEKLLVDAGSSRGPASLLAGLAPMPPKTAIGVGRTLTTAGVDVRVHGAVVPWYTAVGTSHLARGFAAEASWDPQLPRELEELGLRSSHLAARPRDGRLLSPLARLLQAGLDDALADA